MEVYEMEMKKKGETLLADVEATTTWRIIRDR